MSNYLKVFETMTPKSLDYKNKDGLALHEIIGSETEANKLRMRAYIGMFAKTTKENEFLGLYFEGYTIPEIGKLLKVSRPTAYNIFSDIKKRIRQNK